MVRLFTDYSGDQWPYEKLNINFIVDKTDKEPIEELRFPPHSCRMQPPLFIPHGECYCYISGNNRYFDIEIAVRSKTEKNQVVIALDNNYCRHLYCAPLFYREPFFGGGSIFFAKQPCPHETINDADEIVMTFFRVLRDRPDEFIARCRSTEYHYDAIYAGKYRDKVLIGKYKDKILILLNFPIDSIHNVFAIKRLHKSNNLVDFIVVTSAHLFVVQEQDIDEAIEKEELAINGTFYTNLPTFDVQE